MALVALGFVVGLRWLERALTFHAARLDAQHPPRPPTGAGDVSFIARDGTRLHGWYFKAEASAETPIIIYFHGNGGNVTNVGWLAESLAQRGFNVLVFDYRGYGLSDGEAADEAGLSLRGRKQTEETDHCFWRGTQRVRLCWSRLPGPARAIYS